ncbi:hypothetical protein Landi51_13910 [Colletotrichum acutatum]
MKLADTARTTGQGKYRTTWTAVRRERTEASIQCVPSQERAAADARGRRQRPIGVDEEEALGRRNFDESATVTRKRCYDVYDALTSDQPAEERMSPQPLLPTLPDDSREDTVARDDKQTERQHVHEAQPTSLGRDGPRRYGLIAPRNHGHEHILGRDEEGDATS